MKKKTLSTRSFIFLTIFVLPFSCIRKESYDKIQMEPWEPSFAIPVINGTLSLKDIAENVDKSEINVEEGADGLYTFVYRDTLESDMVENLIQIPNQSISESFSINSTDVINLNAGLTVEKSYSETAPFQMDNGQEIKFAELKRGNLNLTFSSTFQENIEIEITFNSLQKDGISLTRTYNLNYSGNTPITLNDNIDLNNYLIDLSGNGTTSNTFSYSATATITSSGTPVTGTESIEVDFSFTDLKYKKLVGNIGNYQFPPYDGSVLIEVFENAQQGEVIFNDPSLQMTVVNTLGVKSGFTVNKFETETDYGSVTPVVSSSSAANAFKIPGPNIITSPTTPGLSSTSTFIINGDNSNIVQAMSGAPSSINYGITPFIQSDGMNNNYLLDTSKIKIYTEARIPLDGAVKVYTMRDTVRDIELPERDFIDLATFKIKTTNSLPIDVTIQGFWLDSTGKILDTIMIPPKDLILSGQIDNNGEVVAPSSQYIEITYDGARYSKMKHATMLLLEGDLASSMNGTTPVKFFSFNDLKIQISVFLKAKIEF